MNSHTQLFLHHLKLPCSVHDLETIKTLEALAQLQGLLKWDQKIFCTMLYLFGFEKYQCHQNVNLSHWCIFESTFFSPFCNMVTKMCSQTDAQRTFGLPLWRSTDRAVGRYCQTSGLFSVIWPKSSRRAVPDFHSGHQVSRGEKKYTA